MSLIFSGSVNQYFSIIYIFLFTVLINFAFTQQQSNPSGDGGASSLPLSRNNNNNSQVCDPNTCKLPLCKCANTEIPAKMELAETPMMIMLTFNGIVQRDHVKYIKKILNPLYRNPNGCPVQATFFVSDQGAGSKSDYCLVQTLFNNNNEIAVGAPKYNCPYTDCNSLGKYFQSWGEDSADKAIYTQKLNIAKKGKLNRSFLRGFRVPYLDSKGNAHYKALRKYAFNYDSSVVIRPEDIKKLNGLRIWPHTLDYPVNYTCENCPNFKQLCENKACSMQSFWVVPMHYLDAEGPKPCPTLIAIESPDNRLETERCRNPKEMTKAIIEETLFTNFERHYITNKAPFVLNIEMAWFNTHGDMLTDALVKFINELINRNNKNATTNDIYFVTIAKALDWIEYPTPLNVIANKWLWDCDGVEFDYDQECDFVDQLTKNIEEIEKAKANNTKIELDLRGEDLFRNGVLTGVIVFFVLSILFVILYDKYH